MRGARARTGPTVDHEGVGAETNKFLTLRRGNNERHIQLLDFPYDPFGFSYRSHSCSHIIKGCHPKENLRF